MTDEALMLSYKGGDAGAFEVLYSRHKGGLFRYLQRQCGNAAIAEELYQEVWMKVIGARAQYKVQAKFTTWLYRMARNHFIDYCRRKKTAVAFLTVADDHAIEDVPAHPGQQPEQIAETREQAGILMRLLAQLPAEQREAFVLREEGGFSIDEIAAITGVNAETAKSRLRYAVNKLRAGLEQT